MKPALKIIPLLLILLSCTGSAGFKGQLYIRLNQIGFTPEDYKSALILSNEELGAAGFGIIDASTGKNVLKGNLVPAGTGYASFNHAYKADFTELKTGGNYYLSINGSRSNPFSIGRALFKPLVDSLLAFFRVQRCGYTNPELHGVCHIADATSVFDGKNNLNVKIDLTGGWHDAGDYVKFLNTTAVATYTLLFAYDFDPVKFGFDDNKNNIPDILEEAKIGLDWLLRCYYSPLKLVTQVQDLRDHDVGWRMPENDKMQFDRPAFLGGGKNLTGIYSAVLALASRIWKDKIKYPEFADRCKSVAETVYSNRNKVPDLDTSATGNYRDKNFTGKLALGAYELYSLTGKKEYLDDSFGYASKAGSDYWWSWGDINALVHYRLAHFDRKYLSYIENNLEKFSSVSAQNLFNNGANSTWGTNNTLLGISLQAVLWKKITGSTKYDRLAQLQRDFVLGRNPWGVSFISGFGYNPVKHLHHQVAFLDGGKVNGALAAGPASKEFITSQKIKYENGDPYSLFQTDSFYYRDDRMDYVTNEPTIVSNATALFVFGVL